MLWKEKKLLKHITLLFAACFLLVDSEDTLTPNDVADTELFANATLELRCRNPNDYTAYITQISDNADEEKCILDATGQLVLQINIVDTFSLTDNYTCENGTWKSTAFQLANTTLLKTTVPLSDHKNFSEQTLSSCTSNGSLTMVWKKNGKTVCRQCLFEEKAKHLGICYGPILCVVFIVLLVMAVLAVGFVYVRRRSSEIQHLCQLYEELTTNNCCKIVTEQSVTPLHQQVDELPYNLNYEIRVNRLKIKKVISDGNYGRVYSGDLKSKPPRKAYIKVVVKGPKRSAKYADMKALSDELKIMMALGLHPNVVCLVGVITENLKRGGDLCGIFEDTDCQLKTFLKDRRDQFINELHDYKKSVPIMASFSDPSDNNSSNASHNLGAPITTSLLNLIAYQVANGMDFLTRKHFIHRDLAARNILVCRNRTIRITGFGQDRQWDVEFLMRSIQYSSPYKTMARESISTSQFTEKSDVWSYGILLWELFSLGDDPFKGFETPKKLEDFYAKGNRLPKPDYMPNSVSKLMYNCWREEPDNRPCFAKCREIAADIAKQDSIERFEMLQNQLNEEFVKMHRYVDWRDGPSHDMIRIKRKASQYSKA